MLFFGHSFLVLLHERKSTVGENYPIGPVQTFTTIVRGQSGKLQSNSGSSNKQSTIR